MAQLNITLDQAEILQLLSENSGEAFKNILQASLNKVLQVESAEQLKAAPYERSEERTDCQDGCSFSGEKVDGHIDIDLDVEKLEGKSGIATYAEIKAYIKEKYGFNVTNLYIGQIKDKAGIKDRKNYNTGSGDGKVPVCPPEKEKAIMDAFKHFGLI